jgi:hypothetical protein
MADPPSKERAVSLKDFIRRKLESHNAMGGPGLSAHQHRHDELLRNIRNWAEPENAKLTELIQHLERERTAKDSIAIAHNVFYEYIGYEAKRRREIAERI